MADALARAWRVLEALGATAGVFAFWLVVLFVVPGILAVYLARLFPLTGRWRARWRARRETRRLRR
ncbi:MAG TPA: hypothetical protein VLT86_11930 [Vicinamibacterales bacterium]|nr:hypothetical protein [Vicinamibacterales bacterium]